MIFDRFSALFSTFVFLFGDFFVPLHQSSDLVLFKVINLVGNISKGSGYLPLQMAWDLGKLVYQVSPLLILYIPPYFSPLYFFILSVLVL